MLGEATLDVSGTFAGEAIRVFILFVAQHLIRGRSQGGLPNQRKKARSGWRRRVTFSSFALIRLPLKRVEPPLQFA
jgi:hypothetical protein